MLYKQEKLKRFFLVPWTLPFFISFLFPCLLQSLPPFFFFYSIHFVLAFVNGALFHILLLKNCLFKEVFSIIITANRIIQKIFPIKTAYRKTIFLYTENPILHTIIFLKKRYIIPKIIKLQPFPISLLNRNIITIYIVNL